MPAKYTIHVTKEIIEQCKYVGAGFNGVDAIGGKCPVALALKDLFKDVHVTNRYIFPCGADAALKINLPQNAANFIKHFDAFSAQPEKRLRLKAFRFTIIVPEAVLEVLVDRRIETQASLEALMVA